jgi:polysaccharide pyruvyl transferase WcaK-like protein
MQWPDDYEAAKKVVSHMCESATLLEEEYTTTEMLSLVGNLDLLIGIRLHALIFAAVMHVPLLGISYDPKIDRFLETMSVHHVGSLQSVTFEAMVQHIQGLWPETLQPNGSRQERINELRNKAFSNAEQALALIDHQ